MPKQKITIHLDSEIAEKLRQQSIEKYHNSRSMSRLIEDLATGAAEAKQPEACSVLGHRTEISLRHEKEFNKIVNKIENHLKAMDQTTILEDGKERLILGTDMYFALKEACELKLNALAADINRCWSCHDLNGPLPTFPDAGKNFEHYAMMDNNLR